MRVHLLAIVVTAALCAAGLATWLWPRSSPAPQPPSAAAGGRPAHVAASAARAAPAGELTSEQVRAQFAAQAAIGPSSAAPGGGGPRPGESGVDFLQRLNDEARRQSPQVASPFGGASSSR